MSQPQQESVVSTQSSDATPTPSLGKPFHVQACFDFKLTLLLGIQHERGAKTSLNTVVRNLILLLNITQMYVYVHVPTLHPSANGTCLRTSLITRTLSERPAHLITLAFLLGAEYRQTPPQSNTPKTQDSVVYLQTFDLPNSPNAFQPEEMSSYPHAFSIE